MTSDQLKAFITSKLCCVQQKTDAGYLSISRGGKDPACDIHHAFLANVMLHVLKCIALDEVCTSESEGEQSECKSITIGDEWTVKTVCVNGDCVDEYSNVEFVTLVDSVWTFSESSSINVNEYQGDVTITSPHFLGEVNYQWELNQNGDVTSDFSWEEGIPYEGNIYQWLTTCDEMTITFNQDGELDDVIIYLERNTPIADTHSSSDSVTNCEFFCLSDEEICDIVNWLKRYCKDCKDYSPKPLTKDI